MKTPFQRILGLNLAIILVAAVVLRLLNRGRESVFGFALTMALVIASLFFINALLGAMLDTKEKKQAHWLSALLVLLVGFGACMAGASIRL